MDETPKSDEQRMAACLENLKGEAIPSPRSLADYFGLLSETHKNVQKQFARIQEASITVAEEVEEKYNNSLSPHSMGVRWADELKPGDVFFAYNALLDARGDIAVSGGDYTGLSFYIDPVEKRQVGSLPNIWSLF